MHHSRAESQQKDPDEAAAALEGERRGIEGYPSRDAYGGV